MRIGPFEIGLTKKSLANPTPEEFSIFAPNRFDALSNTAVANAVSLIAEGAATLDINLTKRGTIGDHVTNHPALDLLRGEFNPWTSAFEGIRALTASALMHDAPAIGWVNRVNDKPVEIIVYDPGRITVTYAADGSGERSYALDSKPLDAQDIVHVCGIDRRSPVTRARNAIATANAMEQHAKRMFESGAKPGAVVSMPKGFGEDAEKRLKSGFRAAYEGSDKAGKTVFLFDGATFAPMTMTSADAQFLELRRFAIEEIARAFNMSPSMLGDLTRSSYSNGEQKAKEMLSYALEPWLCALETAFNRALLDDDERKTLTFKFDRDDLSRVDLASRTTAASNLIAAEVINPNTAAAWLGLPPHEGGEVYGNRNITVKPFAADKGAPNVE